MKTKLKEVKDFKENNVFETIGSKHFTMIIFLNELK